MMNPARYRRHRRGIGTLVYGVAGVAAAAAIDYHGFDSIRSVGFGFRPKAAVL